MNAAWKKLQDKLDQCLAALARIEERGAISKAEEVASLIELDPHSWSGRPCRTCKAISQMLDRPFGCVKKHETTAG